MKIEIDLKNILFDENYGPETLQESVQRQVVSKLTAIVKDGIGKRIDFEIAKVIDQTIKENIKSIMPETISVLMDTEFTAVDHYGDRGKEPTTFRKQLVKAVHEQLIYKKTNYESDRNAFTKAVDSVVELNVKDFKTDFTKLVNEMFVKEAFEYARKTLFEKLGVK